MSNKLSNSLKKKLLKKTTFSKSPESTVSSSLYSGVASAQRAIQKPGSPFSIRSNQTKRLTAEQVILAPEDPLLPPPPPPIKYHPWESKYNQLFTREKIKKPMTKDPYMQKRRIIDHTNERITTEEECCPVLIPVNMISIDKPIIHIERKVSLPNIVRYVRTNSVMSSEQSLSPPIPTKKSSITPLQVETTAPLPMIGINKNNNPATNLSNTNVLLSRIKLQNNGSAVRRPARRLKMETIHETIAPLAVYA